ncbi:helix-turn-helix domain-containing protein [Lysinibacter cavernae]|uniref:Transcriptional regulator with XRE-family HTH domain n=1 Tax=Lysinibacter cavernae TaxID=1640652 RepID=A0A7X5TTQ2_9MICO|nr:helix-turn-helix transcriptional regulator [Lysinibacter cavernae]NIH53754.1 transcriptional regulator with XRE-family HTH domain [Lysinibacter cavernae]
MNETVTLKINGPTVRVIRERTGMSLTDLAARTGADKGTISRIETGQRRSSIMMLRRIAYALSVPLEAISYPVMVTKK